MPRACVPYTRAIIYKYTREDVIQRREKRIHTMCLCKHDSCGECKANSEQTRTRDDGA